MLARPKLQVLGVRLGSCPAPLLDHQALSARMAFTSAPGVLILTAVPYSQGILALLLVASPHDARAAETPEDEAHETDLRELWYRKALNLR
jgi:multisubunit Na+/H+ antiporter MnhC subunit